jgi:error-prone DNA polymerase
MYVELHARSAFSFLEGSSLPEDLAGMCARLNLSGMALLDIDGVYGAPRFHMAANKIGIKAHIGAEVTYADADAFLISNFQFPTGTNSPRTGGQPTIGNRQSPIASSFRLPLLVSSRDGYQNLCRMITKMKLRAKKGEGAVRKEELEEHAHGLICLTGGVDGPLQPLCSKVESRKLGSKSINLWACLAAAMSTSNCSAISIATEEAQSRRH